MTQNPNNEMMDDIQSAADLVYAVRVRYGLSQETLAWILGVANHKLISQWEGGYRNPHTTVLRVLTLLMGLNLSDGRNLCERFFRIQIDCQNMRGGPTKRYRIPRANAGRPLGK